MTAADVTKLVIERDRWFRGRSNARLLVNVSADSPDAGKMCCLGFFGLACGLSEKEIRGQGEPHEVADFDKWPEWLVSPPEDEDDVPRDSEDCENLVACNDDTNIDDASRESRIAEIFAKHGVTVEFR